MPQLTSGRKRVTAWAGTWRPSLWPVNHLRRVANGGRITLRTAARRGLLVRRGGPPTRLTEDPFPDNAGRVRRRPLCITPGGGIANGEFEQALRRELAVETGP